MICFKSKAKAKSAAKSRRKSGKKAHVKTKKGLHCVVGGKSKKRKSHRKHKR